MKANIDQRNIVFKQDHRNQAAKCFNFTLGYLIINDRIRNMSRWISVMSCFSIRFRDLGDYFSECGVSTLAYAYIDDEKFPNGLRL